MDPDQVIYICPICFRVCESETECHNHMMVSCDTGNPGDERRKPIKDRFGNLVSRAPQWYLEALNKERRTED